MKLASVSSHLGSATCASVCDEHSVVLECLDMRVWLCRGHPEFTQAVAVAGVLVQLVDASAEAACAASAS
eukprot:3440613-Amphidinium_carterae.1